MIKWLNGGLETVWRGVCAMVMETWNIWNDVGFLFPFPSYLESADSFDCTEGARRPCQPTSCTGAYSSSPTRDTRHIETHGNQSNDND